MIATPCRFNPAIPAPSAWIAKPSPTLVRPLRGCVVAALLTACAPAKNGPRRPPEAPPIATVPTPSAASSNAASSSKNSEGIPASSASAAPTAAPAPPPPPPSAGPSGKQTPPSVLELTRGFGKQELRTLDALRSVCSLALKRDGEHVRLGCVSCPPFAADAKRAEVSVDPEQFYEAEAAYFGSFSEADAREAAIVFNGCEPHSANYGGTLLLAFDGSTWTHKAYASGFHPAECRLFTRPDRRDVLVCSWRTDHQMYARSGVGSFDFTRYDGKNSFSAWENLVALEDNSYAACLDPKDMKRRLVADEVSAFDVDPQRARLSIEVRSFHGPKTPAYAEKCTELTQSAETNAPVDVGAALKFKTYHLEFDWRNNAFVPDARTRTLIRQVWK